MFSTRVMTPLSELPTFACGSVHTQRSFGPKVSVGRENILTKRLVVKPTMRVPLGQHCNGLAKLSLLESKVGLQLVKSTEHLCVFQKGSCGCS